MYIGIMKKRETETTRNRPSRGGLAVLPALDAFPALAAILAVCYWIGNFKKFRNREYKMAMAL